MALFNKAIERAHTRSSNIFNAMLREFSQQQLIWEVNMYATPDDETNMIHWNLMKHPVVNKFRLGILAILTRHYGWEVNIIGGGTKEWTREIEFLFG